MATDYTVLPMDKHFRLRRGTTTAVNAYAGVVGEVVIDTTKNTAVLMTGTAGTNYPLARESRLLTAGSGVTFTVDGSVVSSATLGSDITFSVDASALVAANNLLKTDANGKLAADFTLGYDNTTGKFTVLGSDGTTELASVTVPSHLSALSAVSLETATAEAPVNGSTSGTFMHFVFSLSNGTTSDVYVNVTELVDVYSAGDGLTLTGSTFAVNPGNGVEIDTNGAVAAKVKSGETILVCDANGLSIDTTALQTATGQVIVSADADNVLTAGTDGGALLKIDDSADNMLTVNDDGELIVPMDMGTLS